MLLAARRALQSICSRGMPGACPDEALLSDVADKGMTERFRALFYKTSRCKFFDRGCCVRGDECPFAHGPEELRELPALEKLAICQDWVRKRCPFAAQDCKFAHGAPDLRPYPGAPEVPRRASAAVAGAAMAAGRGRRPARGNGPGRPGGVEEGDAKVAADGSPIVLRLSVFLDGRTELNEGKVTRHQPGLTSKLPAPHTALKPLHQRQHSARRESYIDVSAVQGVDNCSPTPALQYGLTEPIRDGVDEELVFEKLPRALQALVIRL